MLLSNNSWLCCIVVFLHSSVRTYLALLSLKIWHG